MKKTLTLTLLCLLGASSVAMAHRGAGGRFFDRTDKDGNGKLSQSEVVDGAQARWSRLDGDKDGRVTWTEVQAHHADKQAEHADRKAKRFAEKDANGDGKLSASELPRMPKPLFERLDANADGFLSQDELGPGRRVGMTGERGHDGKHRGKPGKPGKRGKRFEQHAKKRFDAVDANKDAVVDKPEITTAAKARFKKLDADKDGAVTREEAHRAAKKRFEEHRGGKHDGKAPAKGKRS